MAAWQRLVPLVALAVGLSAGSSSAQTFGPSWTSDSTGEGWTARNVALGDRGGQVISQFGPATDYVRLFSATDTGAALPVWQNDLGVFSYNHRVASADGTDMHVTLHDEQTTSTRRRLVLRKFRSSSSTPEWTYVLPNETNTHNYFDLHTSGDGGRIVVVTFNFFTGRNDILVFDASTPAPVLVTDVTMLGPFKNSRLSADGARLYLQSDIKIRVIDLESGQELFNKSSFEPLFGSHAISGDGSVFAYGTYNKTIVYAVDDEGEYQQAFVHDLPGSWYCGQLDISTDGTTLAAAYVNNAGYLTTRVVAFDLPASLQSGSAVQTMSYDSTGAGSFSNLPSEVEVSADGQTIAVGLWGDELGQAPEVMVFRRDRNAPTHVHDLPGSVRALDLSADGKRLAVASKGVHNNTSGGGGRVDLYDLDPGDLRLHGVPRTGQAVRFELEGDPGRPARLLVARSLARNPSEHPSIGSMVLDRKSGWVVPMGTFDTNGVATLDYVLPPDAAGMTLYFQGAQKSPAKLSESWVKVTVLP